MTLDTQETRQRGFDFRRDYRLLNALGKSLFGRAKRARPDPPKRQQLLQEASQWFERALEIDPENASAHYNLSLIAAQLGAQDKAAEHRRLHETYRTDENARDYAVAVARRNNPAADHAAEAIVIYDLQRHRTAHWGEGQS